MWRERQFKKPLQWDEVKSGQERMPEYCTSSTREWVIVVGVVSKKQRGQKADIIGHFGEGRPCCPKMKGGKPK
jgi:hypothetical protein